MLFKIEQAIVAGLGPSSHAFVAMVARHGLNLGISYMDQNSGKKLSFHSSREKLIENFFPIFMDGTT